MLTLRDLVANQSISEAGAELLRSIAAAGRSFLVYALPRNAGKSTLTHAILAEAPAQLPRTEFFGTEAEAASLAVEPTRGYLVVGEIGHRGRPGYLADDEVPRLFELITDGYTLASSLHADSVDEVFDVLRDNGIATDVAAATIPYLVKVRALGDPEESSTRRVVEEIHEITHVNGAAPVSSLRYRWDAAAATPPA